MQLARCEFLAGPDDIDELEDSVGDVKWSDVKSKSLSEKLDYWNSEYMKMTCEHAKMKALVKYTKHFIYFPFHI